MDKIYKTAVITKDNEVMLFNQSEPSQLLITSDLLTDVHVKYNQNGILEIEGNSVIFDFYYTSSYGRSRVYEKDWENPPHPNYIHEGKPWWKSLFNTGEKERFVYSGWVMTTKTKPVHYVFNNFKLTICE